MCQEALERQKRKTYFAKLSNNRWVFFVCLILPTVFWIFLCKQSLDRITQHLVNYLGSPIWRIDYDKSGKSWTPNSTVMAHLVCELSRLTCRNRIPQERHDDNRYLLFRLVDLLLFWIWVSVEISKHVLRHRWAMKPSKFNSEYLNRTDSSFVFVWPLRTGFTESRKQ